MGKKIGFTITFHRKGKDYKKPLTVEDSHEVGERAVACAFALVFFMTGISPAIVNETDNEEYGFFLRDVGEVLNAFLTVAYDSINELEQSREN